MKYVLIIKTESMFSSDTLRKIQLDFVKQVKSGVVIIPPYFDAELIKFPNYVEVIIQRKGKEK